MSRCFCYGTFDLIHGGVVRFLQWASLLADELVAGIPANSATRVVGDARPLLDHFQRAEVLLSISHVTDVYIYDEPSPLKLARAIRPDALALGHDQHAPELVEFMQSIGGQAFTSPDFRHPHTGEILRNFLLRTIPPICDNGS